MGRRCCRCSGKGFLLTICFLQFLSSIERQVFDFLGQMWGPILFNFFSTIFTLIGMFGVYYKRPCHTILYTIWQVFSVSWNLFLIGVYLEIQPLHQDNSHHYLNLGTGSRSWWESNGPNCEPQYNVSAAVYSYYEFRPISVQGCLLPFYAIETAQAAVHLVLTIIGFIMSFYLLVSNCMKRDNDNYTQRPGISGNVVPSLPHHYSISMSYHPRAGDTLPRNGTLSSQRNALHRQSVNSLPSRRMKRDGSRSRSGARCSTRSTASARRKKRMQRANHNQSSYDTEYDTSSVYRSQNHLINSHYDASSLDSFNPGGHANPVYGGSIQSAGSRFSVYTINPHASTVERINVSENHNSLNGHHPNQHNHYEAGNSHYDPYDYQSHNPHYVNGNAIDRGRRPPEPATIGRRSTRRPRSPIYMNSNETVM